MSKDQRCRSQKTVTLTVPVKESLAITCVGVLFSATATGANMNLLLGKCM